MRAFLLIVALFSSLPQAAAFSTSGFAYPYGVVADPSDGKIYVSNVNGPPNAKNDNGFISRLNADGTIDEVRFIDAVRPDTELDAPKGMAIVGKTLYVADIDHLRRFDVATGKQLENIELGAATPKHLYGLAIGPDGALYAVDGESNRVLRIGIGDDTSVRVFIEAELLGQPHSLVWHPQKELFLIAGWSSGKVTAWDRNGKQQYIPGILLRTLEGSAIDAAGNVYVASTVLRAIYKIPNDFALESLALDVSSAAGLAFDSLGERILATHFDENTVSSYSLKQQ